MIANIGRRSIRAHVQCPISRDSVVPVHVCLCIRYNVWPRSFNIFVALRDIVILCPSITIPSISVGFDVVAVHFCGLINNPESRYACMQAWYWCVTSWASVPIMQLSSMYSICIALLVYGVFILIMLFAGCRVLFLYRHWLCICCAMYTEWLKPMGNVVHMGCISMSPCCNSIVCDMFWTRNGGNAKYGCIHSGNPMWW